MKTNQAVWADSYLCPDSPLVLPLVFAAYWAMNRWTEERGGLRAQNLLTTSCL